MPTKIAIIEDDAPIRMMYEMRLKREAYIVRSAVNGREGLKLIKEFQPHLILLDLKMPEMSGDEMLLHLRQKEWGAEVQVIILTNTSKAEAPPGLRFLSVDRYIVKAHHTPSQIVEIIKETLRKDNGGIVFEPRLP